MSPGLTPGGTSRAKRFPYFMVGDASQAVGAGEILGLEPSNPLYPSRPSQPSSIPMPSKAMCPQCGQKIRGASHVCDPTKVVREQKRLAVLAKLASK